MVGYISRIVEEMIIDNIKFKELIQEETYYVSDVVDYTQFTDHPNQKIIKTSNHNIKKIMMELFGHENVPQLGRNKILLGDKQTVIEHYKPELIDFGKQMVQEIINNRNSIIRSYVNCYYWMHNMLYDKETRNLGYESELQDKITNLFKAHIIDYIANNVFNEEFKKDISQYINISDGNIFSSSINRLRKNNYNTDGILELIILSYIFPYPIVVYNNYNVVKYLFSTGPVSVNAKTIAKYTMKTEQSRTITLKFDYEGTNKIPKKIYSIYYN